MTAIDVVKPSGRGKTHRPTNAHHQKNRPHVRDVQRGAQSNDPFLNYVREMVSEPYQKLSEARFEEMLDILMEQDDFARSKFTALESGLEDVAVETNFLREKYDALKERIDIVMERFEAERVATRAAFEEALEKLREEFDVKASILSETLRKSLQHTEDETKRALAGLSTTVQDNKQESARLFELAQTSSLNSLETRIAQWRAEIEDERKEDMGEVAAALMEIGKRMLTQKR